MKPVLFVTGHAPSYRVGAFSLLAEREDVEFALFGGRLMHGGEAAKELPFPHRHVGRRKPTEDPLQGGAAAELYSLAASKRYRAVVCSTGGRTALAATWAGARRGGVPLLLWASLWAHPRSLAHAVSYPALRRLYRSADAVVTYGPHVSAYVRAHGAGNVHEAPQAVDNAFWSAEPTRPVDDSRWPERARTKFLFAGRPGREKGLGVLTEAWSMSGLHAPTAALVLVGTGSTPPWVPAGGAVAGARHGRGERQSASAPRSGSERPEPQSAYEPRSAYERRSASEPRSASGARSASEPPFASPVWFDAVPAGTLRDFYAAADALVVPSIPTRTFREPWGLVVNEAMNRGLPVIASDAVGAAAGGLVRDGRNGIVVPAGDATALAAALRKLAANADLRRRLGAQGAEDVAAYTFSAWADGFSRALASLGLSRGGQPQEPPSRDGPPYQGRSQDGPPYGAPSQDSPSPEGLSQDCPPYGGLLRQGSSQEGVR